MNESELEKTCKSLSNLPQYRDKSKQEIVEIAKKQINIKQQLKDLDITSMFIDKEEKKLAKELAKKYLQDFLIETVSDKNTLKTLIYLEILNNRLQNIINNLHSKNKAVPLRLIESIHQNIDKISQLKEQLGLTKKEEQQNDAFKYIQELKKKFEIWRKNNPDRFCRCPYCGNLIKLKLRTEFYTPEKFNFILNNRPYNKVLFENYGKTVTIDKKFIASVLEVSEFYVDKMLKQLNKSNETEEK